MSALQGVDGHDRIWAAQPTEKAAIIWHMARERLFCVLFAYKEALQGAY